MQIVFRQFTWNVKIYFGKNIKKFVKLSSAGLNNYMTVSPYSANHNNCRLLCHLLVILKVIFANSVDPDQTAP